MDEVKSRLVEDTNLGLYVWMMPDGQLIGDDEGRYMYIAAKKGDRQKIANITKIAHFHLKDLGMEPQGEPYFMAGHRAVTDEEFEEQKMRASAGLVPDPYDVAAIRETLEYSKKYG
jgi:hypothetical protein